METKKCPYCGEEILAVAKKCKFCKKWLNEEPSTKEIECPVCAEQIDADAAVCPCCNEPINTIHQTLTSSAEPRPVTRSSTMPSSASSSAPYFTSASPKQAPGSSSYSDSGHSQASVSRSISQTINQKGTMLFKQHVAPYVEKLAIDNVYMKRLFIIGAFVFGILLIILIVIHAQLKDALEGIELFGDMASLFEAGDELSEFSSSINSIVTIGFVGSIYGFLTSIVGIIVSKDKKSRSE